MGVHILLHLAVSSKSERKVDSLPPLGLDPTTFGTLADCSSRTAKLALDTKTESLKNIFDPLIASAVAQGPLG
jgi:hypothetical protein